MTSYCPLAWGDKVATAAGPEVAASLLAVSDDLLDARGKAVADWARRVTTDPRSARAEHVDALLEVGFERDQVLGLTLFIALRIGFATVNGALGAEPETEYLPLVHPAVRDAWSAAFLS